MVPGGLARERKEALEKNNMLIKKWDLMILTQFTESVRRAVGISALILFSAVILSSCSSNNVDYSYQINEDGTGYELDGRVSDFPIVIGEHEHPECDDKDAELMALGQEKFDDAVKLYKTMMCLAPEDESKFIYDEYGNELYAMDEAFGTHDSIMELCGNTFAPGAGEWKGYTAVERPEELLDSGLVGPEDSPRPITESLERSMLVEDGMTYISLHSGWDNHILNTELIGVMNHTDTHIEYRLCTTVLDESNAALAVSDEIPQYFYEHSVMKLDLIDSKWLITQMRTELGNEIG